MNIVEELLRGRFITYNEYESENGYFCLLNKFSMNEKSYQIPLRLFNLLNNTGTIYLFDGNFETGDQNYYYNYDNDSELSKEQYEFVSFYLKPILRDINLSKLDV